jgi:hypothetical protein
MLPPGQHPNDPAKSDLDPVGFALERVQTNLIWIVEHLASFEKARNADPQVAESELMNLRITVKDAMLHLQRLSELILAGHTIDINKRLPQSLIRAWFSSCVTRLLAADNEGQQEGGVKPSEEEQ